MVGVDGEAMRALVEELYPICRSITGDGVRHTLEIVRRHVPIEIHEVPSGTKALDWTVPPEWNVRDAFVADSTGRRVIDFREHNLHLVSYSVPVDTRMTLEELRPHLHSLADRPDVIPYRTSYYERSWGFCVSQRQLDALPEGAYHVRVDTTLEPGTLTYGELVIPGSTDEEILLSTHVCHPSLADDNLSGIAVATHLAAALAGSARRHTLRFLFAPGTIGAITWLARNRDTANRIRAGMTLTCLGDHHPFTYKRTVQGNELIDRAATHVLSGRDHHVVDFFPYGYDERQYNSPGFRIPVGSLMRGRHGQFPEYHTSADDVAFVGAGQLADAAAVIAEIVDVIDRDEVLYNLQPYGEPQLGQRGLYASLGGTNIADAQLAMLWVLNLSDGRHSLLDIAERSGLRFATIAATAAVLGEHDLLGRSQPAP